MANVVLVHTDDSGRYIEPYGHQVDTPVLQSLADDGIRFRQACAAGPTCSPSRSAVMTGQSPHVNGMLGLAQPDGFDLDRPDQHLANYLSRNGLETVLSGQQHEIQRDGRDRHELARDVLGYDRTIDGNDAILEGRDLDGNSVTPADLSNAAGVRDFLIEREPTEGDFFLSFGLYNTHQPLPLDQETVDPADVLPPAPLPDVAPVREEMAAYHVLVQYVDECVGLVMDGLEAGGHLDETLVVFTTDHGLPLPYMKANLREGGIGVSLVTRFPDGRRAGDAEDSIVSTMDLYPTFCSFLGVDVPEWVEGPSLLPLTTGEVDSVRDELFSEVTHHGGYEPKRCIRTDRFKYIERFGDPAHHTEGANTDGGRSRDFLAQFDVLDRQHDMQCLYDLYLDPNERENLIDDPDYAEVRERLSDRLHEWMETTEDPILEGPVPHPSEVEE